MPATPDDDGQTTRTSAEPSRLTAYSHAVRPGIGRALDALAEGSRATAGHNGASPSFALDTDALATAGRALADADHLTQFATLTAAAFVAADRSGGRVRRASSALIASLTERVTSVRFDEDGSPRPDGVHGFYETREGSSRHGPLHLFGSATVLAGSESSGHVTGPAWTGRGIEVGAEHETFLGARTRADAGADVGPFSAHGTAGSSLGAELLASARAQAGFDGVGGAARLSGFTGARADVEGELSIGPVEAAGGCHATAGAEGDAGIEFQLSMDEIGVAASLAAALGLGGGCAGSFSFSPRDSVEPIVRGGEWVLDGGRWVLDSTVEGVGKVGEGLRDGWDAGWEWGTNLLG